MIYVGVPNSEQKSLMARRPPVRTIHVTSEELAWDCVRHIRFLDVFLNVRRPRPCDMLQTEYAAWLRQMGRKDVAILDRCKKFLRLCETWKTPPDGSLWAVVTEDGLRLDGSHRAAVAVSLGRAAVPVGVIGYLPSDDSWRIEMLKIREAKIREVAESIA